MPTSDMAGLADFTLGMTGGMALAAAIFVAAFNPAIGFPLAGLGLGALLWRYQRRERLLASKTADLERSVRHLEAAEGLAGIGRWCIEYPEKRHLWSEEMCHIAGLSAGTAPSKALLARIMPEGLSQLEVTLDAHASDTEPFVAEFELIHPSGGPRILRARARYVFSREGERECVFMVVRDNSEEYASVREAEIEKQRALKLAEEARREANTDALTGLASRRAIMSARDRAVLDAHKSGKAFSVVVIDVDHFKRINDRHGHAVGDRVLSKLAEIAIHQARGADRVGRMGGEEFLWLLPDCDEDAAKDAAERLRWAIEVGTHSAPVPQVTISAGHATLGEGEGALSLFARADKGLYDAKRSGRNRVIRAA